MKLLDLELDHLNLYCPATGVQILSEEDMNDDAPSFVGYWLDEFMTEPTIKNKQLAADWEKFYDEFEEKQNREPKYNEVEQFLIDYPEQNWVIYKITTCGMACGPVCNTVYIILDMNYMDNLND